MEVYCVTNLINGRKYIGSNSTNDPKYMGSGVDIKKDIKKYGRENFTKQIMNNVDDIEVMKELEEYWIEYFDAVNNPMFYNLTKYPAGITTFPKDKIENIIKANKGNKYHLGHKQSDFQKSQTRKANIGRKHTKEHIEWRRNYMKGNKYTLGYKFTQEQKDKISKAKSKSIIQYDIQGNFIQEWPSIRKAGKELNIDEGMISNICNGKKNSTKGFIFKFK